MTAQHHHRFVEDYDGLVAFGFSREVDEKSLMVYLQKFSDDDLMALLVPRMSDNEIQQVFDLLTRLLRTHLKDEEYHGAFLKDPHEH